MTKSYLYKFIKEEVDNMDFFQQHIKLKSTGKIYKGLCPFHNEKTASFTVYAPGYLHKGQQQEFASFYCFGCGVGGDIIKFNQLLNNIDNYYDSAVNLAKQYGLQIDDDENIKLNYLKNKKVDNVNLLSLDEINLICSKLLHNYISDDRVKEFCKYIDEELDSRNTYQAQSLIRETQDFLNTLYL